MIKYLSAKFIQYLVILLLAISINFALPRAMPGTPLKYLAGEDVALLPESARREILQQHGLDKPLWEQYLIYLFNLFQGNLGFSYQQQQAVTAIIFERLPWTVLLVGSASVLSALIGIIVGTIAAWRRGKKSDIALLASFMFLDSMPSFWLGMILISLFAVQLRLFPIFGAKTPWEAYIGADYVLNVLWHLTLPLSTLVLISMGGMFLTMRYSMLAVLGEDYILMAKAKGLGERKVVYRHAMRNALLPVATVLMLNLGAMTGGATVVETVFSYPGLGRLVYEAALSRDYPLLQGGFLLFTMTVILANIIADLIYPILDPRVRRVGGRY